LTIAKTGWIINVVIDNQASVTIGEGGKIGGRIGHLKADHEMRNGRPYAAKIAASMPD
jgi:hypothetical protein